MRAQFIRGAESKKEILDKILNRIITLEMMCANVELNSKGNLDQTDKDTRYFVNYLKKVNVDFKVTGKDKNGMVYVTISGPKENIVKALVQWDAHGRNQKQLAKALEDWNGDEEDLWDIIG
mgnify:CR=1 FL=1